MILREEVDIQREENLALRLENDKMKDEIERLRKALNEKRHNITNRDFSGKRILHKRSDSEGAK